MCLFHETLLGICRNHFKKGINHKSPWFTIRGFLALCHAEPQPQPLIAYYIILQPLSRAATDLTIHERLHNAPEMLKEAVKWTEKGQNSEKFKLYAFKL